MKYLSCLAWLFLWGALPPCKAEIVVRTDFEGGNAEVVSLNQQTATLRIQPSIREGRGWPCWWYLRVEGLKPGQQFTLEVQAQTKPYLGNNILNASWCQPKHASISLDGIQWKPSPKGEITREKIAIYQITAESKDLWMAWGPPFVPTNAEALLASLAAKVAGSQRFELAKTRGGRAVPGIRVGAIDAPNQVWVNARQHAWEAGGSWVGKGFIEWVCGDDPGAVAMRANTCIHFIPIMDVDNVTLGAGGKDANPRDLNRDWASEPIYPEVAAAQKRIREIHQRQGLDVFIDLHNPGPDDPVFFFGPFGYDKLTGITLRNYQRWLELAAAKINEPLRLDPKYHFANYVKTDEERGRMSSGWVRANTGPATISLTLETAWNSPFCTSEGYGKIGAGLGRTLAAYLKENPRRQPNP